MAETLPVPNADLPPDKRLSWLTQVWPTFMEGGIQTRFDRAKAWDSAENCPPPYGFRNYTADGTARWAGRHSP